MTRELGSYNTATTRTHVRFQFSTHAAAGGNVAPSSAFEAADIRIYRANNGAAYSATQRSSSAGITMTSPFDTLTGVHDVDIDLTDNTDAGFYAAGYRYSVVLAPDETVDSQTITGVVLGEFEIGPPPVNVTQWTGVATTDLYTADVAFTRDQANTKDEYTVTWFKNGVRVTSGITSPTIQVVKRVDGTDLVASVAMTQIGTTGSYKYDEATNRVTVGEAVVVIVGGTIDGSARSFARVISRDSA